MTALEWDKIGEHFYETGTDRGVLYPADETGAYPMGHAWNGLTTVTQSPSGAEPTKQYADNIPYLTLYSTEEFGATIEAFTYPDEFAECDGSAEVEPGVFIGQQNRKPFGFSYRSRIGNDTQGTDLGYKIYLVYNAMASPSEKAHQTINDSPEATGLSWEVTTTPVGVGTIGGKEFKPTAFLTIDSTKVDAAKLKTFENIIYGTEAEMPKLPLPADVISHFAATGG